MSVPIRLKCSSVIGHPFTILQFFNAYMYQKKAFNKLLYLNPTRAIWFSCYGSEWDFALQVPQRTTARSPGIDRGPHYHDVSALVCLLSNRGYVCLRYSSYVLCVLYSRTFSRGKNFCDQTPACKNFFLHNFFRSNFLLTMSWGSSAKLWIQHLSTHHENIKKTLRKQWKFFLECDLPSTCLSLLQLQMDPQS